jgi:putative membrane protein
VASIKTIYYIILLSHIILAAVIMPFILITVSHGLSSRFDKHRKIAKITWPLWFYVAVTGVVVYFVIAPYYPH